MIEEEPSSAIKINGRNSGLLLSVGDPAAGWTGGLPVLQTEENGGSSAGGQRRNPGGDTSEATSRVERS